MLFFVFVANAAWVICNLLKDLDTISRYVRRKLFYGLLGIKKKYFAICVIIRIFAERIKIKTTT